MLTSAIAGAGITPADRITTLTVENIPITLIDHGSGTPTLLLHGIFDSADTWRPLIERSRAAVRYLAPDLPGFGRSGAPANFDGGLPHLAEFVEHLLDAAGITGPINLVGYDIGATYGLAWAVTHPARVRRLVIMNSNFFSDYRWHPWARLWRIPVLGDLIMATVNGKTFANAMRQAAPLVPVEQAEAAGRLLSPASKRMALRHYRALDSANFRGWEDKLLKLVAQVPTLVCWGDKDPYVSASWADRFGAREVYHYPEASHWLPLEVPESLAEHFDTFFGEAS